MRHDLVKATISGSSSSGTKQVKEEEDVALTSKGQHKRKKNISKIKCFKCGEMGHYNTQCPLKKRENEEKWDQQVVSADIDKLSSRMEEEFTMIVEMSPGVRYGDRVVAPECYSKGRIL